jgi:hypothetical protein
MGTGMHASSPTIPGMIANMSNAPLADRVVDFMVQPPYFLQTILA